MNRTKLVIILIAVLFGNSAAYAQELKTFEFEGVGGTGTITVTQDIPAYFLGDYMPVSPELQVGKMLLVTGSKMTSHHWWDKDSRGKYFTWGVLVKNGKIETEKVTPPNKAYKPYERMKLIIRYQEESSALVVWGLYRAESVKYGTRIVAGRYLKGKGK